jgi:tRNA threonylcarbamoyladenosine biosynthesis protein TsaB
MRLLAIDTSTQTGGVAVLEGETTRAAVHTTSPKTHAGRLMAAVDATLKMADTTMDDIDGFAVTTGPGSFTGLRIGIGAVKGFALATGKPVAGVSTLDVLAHQLSVFSGRICPLLDARKGQIYTALYRSTGTGEWKAIEEPCVADPGEWLKRVDPPCLFAGDGLNQYKGLVERTYGMEARFAPAPLNSLHAGVVGWLGMRQIEGGKATDAARISPCYVRKSDAEIKLEKGLLRQVPQNLET